MGFSDTDGQPRIKDLSSIEALDFKQENTSFLQTDAEYEQTDYDRLKDLRHQIWSTRNGDIRRVLYDFPVNAPLHEQCAGWMHAIAGKHFFPDANHRTALSLLRTLLYENGLPPGRWPPTISRDTVLRSHIVRRQIPPVQLDTLYRHDPLFLVWILYFKNVLRNPVR